MTGNKATRFVNSASRRENEKTWKKSDSRVEFKSGSEGTSETVNSIDLILEYTIDPF